MPQGDAATESSLSPAHPFVQTLASGVHAVGLAYVPCLLLVQEVGGTSLTFSHTHCTESNRSPSRFMSTRNLRT